MSLENESDCIAQNIADKIEFLLLERVEIIENRVPTDEEIKTHGKILIENDCEVYYYRDQKLLVVSPLRVTDTNTLTLNIDALPLKYLEK